MNKQCEYYKSCDECMKDAPYRFCCRLECCEHEFCRGCLWKGAKKDESASH